MLTNFPCFSMELDPEIEWAQSEQNLSYWVNAIVNDFKEPEENASKAEESELLQPIPPLLTTIEDKPKKNTPKIKKTLTVNNAQTIHCKVCAKKHRTTTFYKPDTPNINDSLNILSHIIACHLDYRKCEFCDMAVSESAKQEHAQMHYDNMKNGKEDKYLKPSPYFAPLKKKKS